MWKFLQNYEIFLDYVVLTVKVSGNFSFGGGWGLWGRWSVIVRI